MKYTPNFLQGTSKVTLGALFGIGLVIAGGVGIAATTAVPLKDGISSLPNGASLYTGVQNDPISPDGWNAVTKSIGSLHDRTRQISTDSNENVGIGTSSPTEKLNIAGNVRVGSVNPIDATNTAGGYGNVLRLSGGPGFASWNSENSDPVWLSRYNTAADSTELRANIGDDGGDEFVVGITNATGWIPKVTIGSNGDVVAKGNVISEVDSGYSSIKIGTHSDTNWQGGFFMAHRSRGTKAAPTAVQTGDALGVLDFWGYDGNNDVRSAQIAVNANALPIAAGTTNGSDGKVPSEIKFLTTDVTNGLTEKMSLSDRLYMNTGIIFSGDRWMLWENNTTAIASDANGIAVFMPDGAKTYAVDGPSAFKNTAKFNKDGSLWVGGSVTASSFLYTSDERLKKDITPLSSALSKVLQLKGVSFLWKSNDQKEIGFIAQAVEKVFPELVVTDPQTGFKAVKYGNITALLVSALQEQQTQIDELKAQNTALEARLSALEAKIAQ